MANFKSPKWLLREIKEGGRERGRKKERAGGRKGGNLPSLRAGEIFPRAWGGWEEDGGEGHAGNY